MEEADNLLDDIRKLKLNRVYNANNSYTVDQLKKKKK